MPKSPETDCRHRDFKATAGSAPRLDLENVDLEGSEEGEEMLLEAGGRGSILRIGRKLSEAVPCWCVGSRTCNDKLGCSAEEISKSRVESAACFYPAAQSKI